MVSRCSPGGGDGRLLEGTAAEAGADAIGLVFYEPSPRYVTVEQAQEIVAALPPFVSIVSLFVTAHVDLVEQVLSRIPVATIQFHGYESVAECERYGWPYMKAIRVAQDTDVVAEIAAYPSASGILLDTYKKGVPGGTGEVFNWNKVPDCCDNPIIRAGGLTAENVAAAVTQVRPYAVDVSGGVEQAPGIKSAGQITRFMAAVKQINVGD